MAWISISKRVSASDAPQLEALFEALGAVAVTSENATTESLFETEPHAQPGWPQQTITGLFGEDVDKAQILSALQSQISNDFQPLVTYIEDQDWERTWLKGYEPIKVGENLWIVPSWLQPSDDQAINIKIDPGLAFGTGTHATTHLCLQALSESALDGKHVIDYGCGSGILAIAALKLGAHSATGTDIEPRALLTSRDNAKLNNVDSQFTALPVEQANALTPVDLVIANILAQTLKALAATLEKLVKPGGWLWLSGITREQVSDVINHYPCFEFTTHTLGDWCLAQGIKQLSPSPS